MDMSEIWMEHAILEQEHDNFIEKLIENRKWLTVKGERIEIEDMTTLHIRNSLTKCIRESWREEFIPLLKSELLRRESLQ